MSRITTGAMPIVMAVLGAGLLTVADCLLKACNSQRSLYFCCAVALYGICTVPAYWAFNSSEYRFIFNVWAIAAVLMAIFVSVVIFREQVTLAKIGATVLIAGALFLENL